VKYLKLPLQRTGKNAKLLYKIKMEAYGNKQPFAKRITKCTTDPISQEVDATRFKSGLKSVCGFLELET
jgi:hypothetical protein